MPAVSTPGITELLDAWSSGDKSALDRLVPMIVEDLRHIAKRHLDRERRGHSLQTTAVVNEMYVRLVGMKKVSWRGRAHFFAAASNVVRHILVDAARARQSYKRGGHVVQVTFDEALVVADQRSTDLVALDDALTTLAAVDPSQGENGRIAIFWRAQCQSDSRGPQCGAEHNLAGLEADEGVAKRRDEADKGL